MCEAILLFEGSAELSAELVPCPSLKDLARQATT